MAEEGLKKTKNELIHIGCPIPFDTEEFLHQLTVLMKAAYDNDKDIREMVELIVPTYHPAGKNGSENKGKAYELQRKMMEEAAVGVIPVVTRYKSVTDQIDNRRINDFTKIDT